MAWTGQSFSVGQVLTAAQMNNLQADITAHADGDSGAPQQQTAGIADGAVTNPKLATNSVTQTKMDDSAIGRGELNSATASQSTSVSGSSTATISPTGGSYTMAWFFGGSQGTGQFYVISNGSTYAATVGIYNGSSTQTGYLYSRYIQASPPYNLGYGEIPRFNLALLDKNTMEVLGTYSAEDPPWAYHGPHNLHPVDGPLLRSVELWGVDIAAALAGPQKAATLQKLKQMRDTKGNPKALRACRKDHAFSIEDKNIDMDVVPHLFSNYDPAKHVVIMLDPLSKEAEEIALGEEFTGPEYSVSNLLHDGYIDISNEELAVNRSPAGVLTVKFKWKKGK